MLALTLPLPPSVNHLYIRTRGGLVVRHPRVLAYAEEVRYAVLAARNEGHRFTPTAPLVVTVHVVFPPDRIRRDLDNVLKCLGDSLAAALGFDDDDIMRWVVSKERGAPARCEVCVEAWHGEAGQATA